MIFSTYGDVLYWTKSIGKQNEIIVIIRSNSEIGQRRKSTKLILDRENVGRYMKEPKSLALTTSTMHKCSFKLRAVLLKVVDEWIVCVSVGFHNHQLVATLKGHTYLGQLIEDEKCPKQEQSHMCH